MTGTALSHRSDEERRVPATAVVQAEFVAHQLARELLTNAERDAGEVARRIHAQMPEFGNHAAVTAQTVDAVRAVIAAYARVCLRGVEATEVAPPAEAVEYAHAFVRRGIELPLLVRIYRLGTRSCGRSRTRAERVRGCWSRSGGWCCGAGSEHLPARMM
jgi:hypothetical protein